MFEADRIPRITKRTGKTKVRRLASIHVGLYVRLCVYVLGLGSGQQCGADFFYWPMPGEGRASANYSEAARSGAGSSGHLMQSLPSTLFTRINNFPHCQATALVAQGTPSDAGAKRCVFPLVTRRDHGVPRGDEQNSLWSPEGCLGEGGSVFGDPAKMASLESLLHPARLSPPPLKPRRSLPQLISLTCLLRRTSRPSGDAIGLGARLGRRAGHAC